VHFVLRGLLGTGGSSNNRIDQVGKAVGEYLRAKHVPIPVELLDGTQLLDGTESSHGTRPSGRTELSEGTRALMDLTSRVADAVAKPAEHDEFDAPAALAELLGGIGLTPADSGGRIDFLGADPVVPSTLRLGGASSLALAAKAGRAGRAVAGPGGAGQDIELDLRATPHRLCPFYDRRWELLNGYRCAPAT